MRYLYYFGALQWLALMVVALHRSQAPHERSWWRTGSWTVQFVCLLIFVREAVLPPQLRGWTLLGFLIVVGLLPLLFLFDAMRRERRDSEESSTEKTETGLTRRSP